MAVGAGKGGTLEAERVENGGEGWMVGKGSGRKNEEEQMAAEKRKEGEKGQAAAVERLVPVPKSVLDHQPRRQPVPLKNPYGPRTRSDGAAPAPASRA